jgi:hypothetical protein
MADSSDVQNALAALIAAVLYPAGTGGVGGWSAAGGYGVGMAYGGAALATSAAGLPVRIYRGWPVAQQLDPDLAAGAAHVTVSQPNGMGRLAGGNIGPDLTFPGAPPTITTTVSGNVVTLGGTATPGNLVGLIVDGAALSYQVQPGDALLMVATQLADLIPGSGPGTTTGLTLTGGTPLLDSAGYPLTLGDTVTVLPLAGGGVSITIGTTRPITARVASPGLTLRRPRQQTEQVTVTCWAPTPAARDAICKLFDAVLSDIRWLVLADQQARLVWAGTRSDDVSSKAALWRRDVFYRATYWTTRLRITPSMLFGQSVVTDATGTTFTSNS